MTTAEVNITELKTSKKARAKRLKVARSRVGLTRVEIERKYGISRLTQANWENGKANGLTEKGAKRVVYALKQEGLHCTIDWLMDGMGSEPYAHDRLYIGDEVAKPGTQSHLMFASIEEEIATFRRCNEAAIDFQVVDDGMLPYYAIGDYVAGIQRFGADTSKIVGCVCIVVLKNRTILLRHLRKGDRGYTLVCTNPNTRVEEFVKSNQELVSAAPVIWHRKLDVI